jgi:hypothetical protein
MAQGKRAGFSAAQRTEVWSRWKAGQWLHEIGHAFGKVIRQFAFCCRITVGLFRRPVDARS